MERLERREVKAEERRKRADEEIERLEQALADEEVEELNKKRKALKLQANIEHENYLKKKAEEQQIKNEADTPEAKTREIFRHAKEIRDKDISRGLTWEERKYKYMDAKTRRDCDNMIAQGEAKDIRDFLKKKRLKKEASEQRRRRLKGL